jgi:protein-tyrosine phosphatase
MIDMHNHLLFGVDDGCKTIEESLVLIQKAISIGVTDIILTPHYAPLRGYVKSVADIHSKFQELQQKVVDLQLPVKLYLGREIDEVDDLLDLLVSKKVQTINDSNYVLLDFGMRKTDIDEYVYELIIQGYKPIIAHPERYSYIEDVKYFHKWKKTGALLQLNASSLYHPKNKQVKKHAIYLLKNGLIDFVGSDCHRNPQSYDDFLQANEKIVKKYPLNVLKTEQLLRGN